MTNYKLTSIFFTKKNPFFCPITIYCNFAIFFLSKILNVPRNISKYSNVPKFLKKCSVTEQNKFCLNTEKNFCQNSTARSFVPLLDLLFVLLELPNVSVYVGPTMLQSLFSEQLFSSTPFFFFPTTIPVFLPSKIRNNGSNESCRKSCDDFTDALLCFSKKKLIFETKKNNCDHLKYYTSI